MGRSLYSCDNAYNIPNIKVTGHVCKTNTASATAFRGFGTPQAMLVTETWMDAVADVVGRSAVEVLIFAKDNLMNNLHYFCTDCTV